MVRQCLRSQSPGFLHALRLARRGCQIAQGARPPLAQHAGSGFDDRMKETGNARLVAYGTEREGEESLLEVAIAIEEYALILKKGRFAG